LALAYIALVHPKRPAAPVAAGLRSAVATPSINPAAHNYGLPVRLVVPKLGVNAPIEYMGTTADGAMDVPVKVTEAGWYKYGPHPGDTGSAVIAGHLDGPKGEPGVFIHLNKLVVGDTFTVTDDTGKTTSFVVRQIRNYNQNDLPTEVFQKADGVHVNLITCSGAWNKTQQRFQERLVVFGDKTQ
jgi:sortase A